MQKTLANLIALEQVPLRNVLQRGILQYIRNYPKLIAAAKNCFNNIPDNGTFPVATKYGPKGFDILVDLDKSHTFKKRSGIQYLAIELDEEQHFNRYRKITLAAPEYGNLSKFPFANYIRFCDVYEPLCIAKASHLGYWSRPSSKAVFGNSNSRGNLSPPGSARWRQRAFYDFLRDIVPLANSSIAVVRLSIYDCAGLPRRCKQLAFLLKSSSYAMPYKSEIVDLIESRF